MANFEKIRQHNKEEKRMQERLDSLGVPEEGTERENGECPDCGGVVIEKFYRYHVPHISDCEFGPVSDLFSRPQHMSWNENGGEWRSIHDEKACIRHLRELVKRISLSASLARWPK